jgi:hypothetical protein
LFICVRLLHIESLQGVQSLPCRACPKAFHFKRSSTQDEASSPNAITQKVAPRGAEFALQGLTPLCRVNEPPHSKPDNSPPPAELLPTSLMARARGNTHTRHTHTHTSHTPTQNMKQEKSAFKGCCWLPPAAPAPFACTPHTHVRAHTHVPTQNMLCSLPYADWHQVSLSHQRRVH